VTLTYAEIKDGGTYDRAEFIAAIEAEGFKKRKDDDRWWTIERPSDVLYPESWAIGVFETDGTHYRQDKILPDLTVHLTD
jgi:hypothetical protein